LFAERGFRRVTVREICRDARANVASVNYHFRDKLGLYREVLDQAGSVIQELTAAAMKAGAGRSAEEKLRIYIELHCERIFALGGTSAFQQLLHREMQEPTPALEPLIDRAVRPRFEYLTSIISEILGIDAEDERVVQSAVSIHAQVVTFRPSPIIDRFGEHVKEMFTVDRVSRHIASFALEGIGAYRRGRVSKPRHA
jgi:AcrR family transcriptional regulator